MIKIVQLRQYQRDMLNNLWKSLKVNNKILFQAQTGCGKTLMASKIIDLLISRGNKVAFVCDRHELVEQSYNTFSEGKVSVIKAGYEKLFDANKPIQLIMIQTFHSRKKKLPDMDIQYFFIDECHQNWNTGRINELLKIYSEAKVIGLSATPTDNKGYLLNGFDDYIEGIQIKELIQLGFLCEPTDYIFESYGLDLSIIDTVNGDYDTKQIDEQVLNMAKVDMIVSEWERLASDRKTLVFANSIKHSELITKAFKDKGHNFEVIHSKSNNRQVIDDLKQGKIQGLVNVSVLIAGFDCPDIDCIIDARPTKIERVTRQLRGRGLRIAPNKTDCIILDFAGAVSRFGWTDDLRFYQHQKPKDDEILYKMCPECSNIELVHIKECTICGYLFEIIEEEETNSRPKPKKELERLILVKSYQDELYDNIKELVKERGYKNGYAWHLFKDLLTNAKQQSTGLIFYQKMLRRIEKCREKNYKLRWLLHQ